MDLLGLISGLPTDAAHIPWDGPKVRVIEHQAHAPGHAALLIESSLLLRVCPGSAPWPNQAWLSHASNGQG